MKNYNKYCVIQNENKSTYLLGDFNISLKYQFPDTVMQNKTSINFVYHTITAKQYNNSTNKSWWKKTYVFVKRSHLHKYTREWWWYVRSLQDSYQ